MSIKDNLRLVKEKVTDEEIKKACKLACLDEFIETLPDNKNNMVNTPMGDVTGLTKGKEVETLPSDKSIEIGKLEGTTANTTGSIPTNESTTVEVTKLNNETAYYNLLGNRVDKSTIEELKEKK